MKFMIASDIHGSPVWCEKLLEAFKNEKADRLVLLGDILYHGPRNGLTPGYDPAKVAAMLNPLREKILAVRGNCDSEVDQMVLEFPMLADYAVIPAGTHLIYATHGHTHNMDSLPPLSPGDILLHGHTHVPAWQEFGEGNLYLNPGSISIPKENTPNGYMTLTTGKDPLTGTETAVFEWKTAAGDAYHGISL